MSKADALLAFAEGLVREQTGETLNDLQRTLLRASLQEVKQRYDDIAEAYQYSSRYLRQDVAPKLWHLLSEILSSKVTKANVRGLLEHQMQLQQMPALSGPQPPASAALPQLPDPLPAVNGIPSEKGRILLVDDHPENLALLSHLLEEDGYEVQQAINGAVALRVISLSIPDLILLDIQMPDIDGYTVCQQLRNKPETEYVPIIFISALDSTGDKVKGFMVGGNDYISKPFKSVEVLARVQTQLKMRGLGQTLQEKEQQLQAALQEIAQLKAKLGES